MKKITALLLVLTLLVSLAGCAGTTATTQAAETTAAPAAGPAAAGEQKLTVWCWDPAFNIYAMKEAEKIYQEKNPDFVLEVIETPWDDVQTKLTTAATSGNYDTLPDIILMQDNAFQKNATNFPDAFTDLTNSGIDFTKFGQSKVAYSVVDGKNYGVPFDNGTSIMALRTDVLAEAGLTVQDFTDITWDQFTALGETVKAKTGKALFSTLAGSPDLVMQMLQSAGESLFKADGTPNMVDNAALAEALRVYTDMVKKGVLVEVNDWDQYIGSFNNGTVAGTMNGCWILGSIQSAKDQSGKWAMTNIPKLNNIPNATNYTSNGGSSWFVTSNCKNPELAADFFANTFAGSVKFYETILPGSGALASYLPAGESAVYAQPSEFFGGQKIFADIITFAGKVPSNNTGVYYYEARDAVGVAITNIVGGADLQSEVKAAEEATLFQMGG